MNDAFCEDDEDKRNYGDVERWQVAHALSR